MKQVFENFWAWYERHLTAHTAIAAILFTWQLMHLFWLTAVVVAFKLLGVALFHPSGALEVFIVIADYVEIPAILTTSFLYFRYIKLKKETLKSALMLFFINSQWLHILWITDEFVVQGFSGEFIAFPLWLAWVAIGIDYLELPVIYDTLKKLFLQIFSSKATRQID